MSVQDFSGDPWREEAAPASATVVEPNPQEVGDEHPPRRVAMVTGGATGLGRAVALEFGRLGCDVAFCFVDLPGRDVRETAVLTEAALTAMGVRAYAACCDVRDSADVGKFVSEICARWGTVHYLVNNAGIANDGALWRLTGAAWDQVVATNLTGAFHCIGAVAPIFREQRFGKIVSISSHLASRPGFGVAPYAASKAGIEALTRAAAVELGPANVNVNAVAPGFIRTERLEELPPEVIERAKKRSVFNRLAEASEVARVVTFLCSDDAGHITGQTIVVDGGLSLG